MKKLIVTLLSAGMALACVGCGGSSSQPAKEVEEVKEVSITYAAEDITSGTDQEFVDKWVEEKGYNSGTINEDGSVTMTMDKEKASVALADLKDQIEGFIAQYVDDEKDPITAITYDDDFENFEIVTKSGDYTAEEEDVAGVLKRFAKMAHSLKAISNYEVKVKIIDADSNAVIAETTHSESNS